MSEIKKSPFEELKELIKDKKFDGIRKIKAYFEKEGYLYYNRNFGKYEILDKDISFVLICKEDTVNLVEYDGNRLDYMFFYFDGEKLTQPTANKERLSGNKLLFLKKDGKVIIEYDREINKHIYGTLYLITKEQFEQLF